MTLRHRPDALLGYHFFPAALSVLWATRLSPAVALYSVTAGPVELEHGGIATESPYVSRTSRFPRWLANPALRICRHFDAIIVRGHRARQFLHDHVPATRVAIIPGSMNPTRFQPVDAPREYDMVFVGRLVPVKQADQFLQIAALLLPSRDDLRAAVVGDGPLMSELTALATKLNLNDNITFLGHVEQTEKVLIRSKIFVLTSRSEGLSIAMAEAMAAGAVPVVSDVGDLGELVYPGKTGYLIPPLDCKEHAACIDRLLLDSRLRTELSHAAHLRAVENNALSSVTGKWDRLLSDLFIRCVHRTPFRAQSRIIPFVARSPMKRGLWTNASYRFWQTRIPVCVKQALRRPLQFVGPQRLLGPDFSRQVNFVRNTERWTADRLSEYQLQQLRRISTLADERSPYYHHLFQQNGFNPRDLRTLADFARLPTCDKQVLREHLREMCVTSPNAPGVDAVSTGGTSGTPLHFFMQTDRAAIEYAYLTTSWNRVGFRLGLPLAVLRGKPVGMSRLGFPYEYDPILRCHYYSVFHMTEENMRRYLQHIRGLGPCFLHVYPSAAVALARCALQNSMKPPSNILGIIAESEITYPQQRELVENVFACRYFSCYGHTEKLVFASECEHSTDYHVWSTYGYFELLDDNDRPVSVPGQSGEIVGTGFINRVVPFIRYRTGDRATYVGESCNACGRRQPIIRDITGHRVQEVLIAGDGSEIPWVALNMHDDTFLHVNQFQFQQTRPGQATLRIVPGRAFDASDRERIARNLGQILKGCLKLEIETTDSIPLSQRGKTIYVEQHVVG